MGLAFNTMSGPRSSRLLPRGEGGGYGWLMVTPKRFLGVGGVLLMVFLLAERGPAATEAAPETDYHVEIVQMSADNFQAVRYEAFTGRAWQIRNGDWEVIADAAAPPRSRYVIKLIALAGDWGAVRYDVKSGRSWRASDGAWVEMKG